MLRAIIQYYNAILESTGLIEKTCGLAELVEKDGVEYPIIYESGNEFSAVSQYDTVKGLSYWRKTDPTTITDADSSRQLRACDKLKLVTYNMKLVAGIPRDVSECDDEFCKEDIADRFMRFLTDSESTIKNSVNAARVNVTVTNIDTNTANIENEEYSGQYQTLPSSYIFIQMTVEIEIQIRKSCLEDQCNDPIVLPLPCPEAAAVNVSNSDKSYDVDINSDLVLPDNNIQSSAGNFTDTVPAADPSPYIIADVNWTDSDTTPQTTEYGQPIVCSPCPSPSGIGYIRSTFFGGQSTSYATYDAGWQLANGFFDNVIPAYPTHVAELDKNAVDPWATLVNNNAFGNLNRFTDVLGGQDFAGNGDYFIDHLTGYGWYRNIIASSQNYNTAITSAQAFSIPSLGFTGFYVPSRQLLDHMAKMEPGGGSFTYTPWVAIGGTGNNRIASSTTRRDSTSQFYGMEQLRARMLDGLKTGNAYNVIGFRLHYT